MDKIFPSDGDDKGSTPFPNTNRREAEIMEIDRALLKKLWNGDMVLCPKCNKDYLVSLHKKKKDNNDFKCTNCGEIYRTIGIFNNLLKENK